MLCEDLAKAIHKFRAGRYKDGYVTFDSTVHGIVIGLKAFADLMYDPESRKYIQMEDNFRHKFMGIPMYRSHDIDLDKFELY